MSPVRRAGEVWLESICSVVLHSQYRLFGAIVLLSAARMGMSTAPGTGGHGQSARLLMLEWADFSRFIAVQLAGGDDWLRRVIRDYMLTHSRLQALSFGLVGVA